MEHRYMGAIEIVNIDVSNSETSNLNLALKLGWGSSVYLDHDPKRRQRLHDTLRASIFPAKSFISKSSQNFSMFDEFNDRTAFRAMEMQNSLRE